MAHDHTTKNTKFTKELYGQWMLQWKCDPVAAQFMGQALFVSRFGQSWPKVPMDAGGSLTS